MEILRFLFYAFLFYLAFRLIFDFILPVYRTTRRIRKGFREMHEQMSRNTPYQQQENYSGQNQGNSNPPGGTGEYIDFEEVKD